eukprot:gene9071-6521_t
MDEDVEFTCKKYKLRMRSEPKPADEAIAERKTVRTVLFEVSTRESKGYSKVQRLMLVNESSVLSSAFELGF